MNTLLQWYSEAGLEMLQHPKGSIITRGSILDVAAVLDPPLIFIVRISRII